MRSLTLLAMVALAACSPGQSNVVAAEPTQQASATHPESGLDIVPLTVTTAAGQEHAFMVEVARSREEQARGLMFRTELGPNEGMIFLRNPPDIASFWMKNTPLPLDIIFIGPDRRISNIAAMAEPYSLESVYSVGPVLGVLELRGGRAQELGIEPGDLVEW